MQPGPKTTASAPWLFPQRDAGKQAGAVASPPPTRSRPGVSSIQIGSGASSRQIGQTNRCQPDPIVKTVASTIFCRFAEEEPAGRHTRAEAGTHGHRAQTNKGKLQAAAQGVRRLDEEIAHLIAIRPKCR